MSVFLQRDGLPCMTLFMDCGSAKISSVYSGGDEGRVGGGAVVLVFIVASWL